MEGPNAFPVIGLGDDGSWLRNGLVHAPEWFVKGLIATETQPLFSATKLKPGRRGRRNRLSHSQRCENQRLPRDPAGRSRGLPCAHLRRGVTR